MNQNEPSKHIECLEQGYLSQENGCLCLGFSPQGVPHHHSGRKPFVRGRSKRDP